MSTLKHDEIAQSATNMDVLLRCPVCKNYLKNPVLLSGCSHNFCSDCIRRSLCHKNECPVCRKTSLRSHLIPNTIVNQLLSAYEIQKKNKMDDIEPTKHKSRSIQCNTFSTNSNNGIVSFMTKKKKNKKRKAVVLDEEGISLEPPLTRRKLNHTNGSTANTVHCPICRKLMVKSFINSHIDECLNNTTSNISIECDNKPLLTVNDSDNEDIDIMHKMDEKDNEEIIRTKQNCPIKIMPFPAYSHLKEKELRKILDTLRLNKNGDKKLLIKRHREFVLRHNAQIDAYLNGNEVMNDRNIVREINNEEGKQIHSKFFAKSNNSNKRNREKRKNKREELYRNLIKDLKIRMGKEWCRKRRKFRKQRRKMKMT